MTSDDLDHPIEELVLICRETGHTTTMQMTPEARAMLQRFWRTIESDLGRHVPFGDFLLEALRRELIIRNF
jgi:hypothetical protein